MCRYDEDYDWYVDAESVTALDRDERCEDCGRVVAAGEPIVEFLHAAPEWERDEAPLVLVAQWSLPGQRFVDETRPVIRATDAQYHDEWDAWADTFEGLGFLVEEVNSYDLENHPPEYSYCCRHCRAGNLWLERVCHQHTVLVTVQDLQQHRYEYTYDDLGPDFCTLETLATQRWRSKLTGDLIPVHVIDRLARDAAAYAVAHGLAHA